MFRYFTKRTTKLLFLSTFFLVLESFVAICETDFIRAMMYLSVFKNNPSSTQIPFIGKTIKEIINSTNIVALYNLGPLNLSLITFAILILGVILGAIGIWLASKMVAIYIADARAKTYEQIQKFSFLDIDKFSSASLVTRLTTDVSIIYVSLSFASKFLASGIFSIIFGIVKSAIDYSNWIFIYAIVIPAILLFMSIIISFATPNMKKGQKDIDWINKQVRETILGMRVVKAYNLEEKQKQKFELPNEALAHTWFKAYSFIGILMPIIHCLVTSMMVLIYFITWNNYDNFQAAGELIGFVGIMMQVLFGFITLIVTITQVARAVPCVKRINEVTSFEPSLRFKEKSSDKIEKGSIEFKNVYHSFLNDEAHFVLKNINFKIKPKEKIGVIGVTGSGKSTLANLICRLFDPTRGEILIDGINAKNFTFKEINSKISIAMQTATLFSGTIRSNIAFGLDNNLDPETLDKEIIAAAKAAEAWEFISKRSDGLDSIVEQRGRNYSGGQKQRISIARTIAKKPKIVIFDDSTSALDTITERKVQSNIKKYNDSTTIIIAQRISSVEELDKIIVINNGEIVGFDSHWNLLRDNQIYRSIAASQLGTEELNEILIERGFDLIEKATEFKEK